MLAKSPVSYKIRGFYFNNNFSAFSIKFSLNLSRIKVFIKQQNKKRCLKNYFPYYRSD
jgi:uncharacterized membrane protein YobD (UPF0266 family)